MTLRVCQECTTRFAVGLLACPHCRSTEHYEEGSVMPKITVHGGPSIAGEQPAVRQNDNAAEPVMVGERGPELWDPNKSLTENLAVAPEAEVVEERPHLWDPNNVVVPEDGGDPYTLGPDGARYYEPQTLAVEDDPSEPTPAPDYEAWTGDQLRAALAERKLPTSGRKAELIERLRAAGAEASDG